MTQIEIGEILSLVGFFTLLSWILSPQFRELLNQWLNQWRSDIGNLFDPYFYLDIPEVGNGNSDKVFKEVKRYWTKRNANEISAQKLTVVWSDNSFEFSLASGETVVESFSGATVWSSYHIQNKNALPEKRWFTLKVAKPSKSILSEYLAHIVKPDSSQLQAGSPSDDRVGRMETQLQQLQQLSDRVGRMETQLQQELQQQLQQLQQQDAA